MNLNNAEFTISAVLPKQYPKTKVPEIALAGRSNVGKSSIINRLLNRKNLARISSKPGKTATLNFYNIDDAMFLVDLPGYGYASRSREETKKWGEMIDTYLTGRKQLLQTILLVDSRHKPTEDDITMLRWIRTVHGSAIVVATKTDKLKNSEIEPALYLIAETLRLTEDDLLVPFSIKGEEGRITMWDIINQLRAGDDRENS